MTTLEERRQEAWARVAQYWGDFDASKSSLGHWVYQQAWYGCLDAQRLVNPLGSTRRWNETSVWMVPIDDPDISTHLVSPRASALEQVIALECLGHQVGQICRELSAREGRRITLDSWVSIQSAAWVHQMSDMGIGNWVKARILPSREIRVRGKTQYQVPVWPVLAIKLGLTDHKKVHRRKKVAPTQDGASLGQKNTKR